MRNQHGHPPLGDGVPVDVHESHALALRSGALIGDRYRIVRLIRSASPFAFSYEAEDATTGDAVVVKEFFPRSLVSRGADGVCARPHSSDCERDYLRALHRFALEGAVLAEVSHPHLLRVRAVIDANATVYLVMDRHESQSLADFVKASQGRLAPADASKIIQQLLTALELLHAESVIHRDLSPRSVHVTRSGTALLLEFSARRHLPMHTTELPAGFAAFEQYGMKEIGPWTDVYAVSALLYYLLTGTTPPSALERAAGEAVASPLMAVPGLAPGLATLVMRGMALLPQQRPHAISELRRQLDSALVEGRATPARNVYTAFSAETSRTEDRVSDDHDGSVPLRLAAGGIVVPGEERGSAKWLRLIRGAAARLGGTGRSTKHLPNETDELEAQLARAAGQMSPARPFAVEERPSPVIPPVAEAPIATASVVAAGLATVVSESSLPALAEPERRFDLTPEIALSTDELDAAFGRSARRQRYSLAAAAALVIAVGGSLILLARNGRASGVRVPRPPATTSASATNAPAAPVAPADVHESVEGGAVLQNAPRVPAVTAHAATDSPTAARRGTAVSRSAPTIARTAEPAADQRVTVLPAGRLPNVKIALSSTAGDLKIVPPELLVDARMRLTNGQDQAEQGDYSVARKSFRMALTALDSVSARYPESQSIKNLRREIEQADTRAVQACTAENEMRKRRGEEARACQ